MLRLVLLALGVLLMATPLIGGAAAILPAAFGALLVLALLIERFIYKPLRLDPPGPGWDRTAERFADPRSGQTVTVYFNPRTGARRYVADGTADEEA